MSNERYSSLVGTHLLDVLNAETDKHFHKRRYRIVFCLMAPCKSRFQTTVDGRFYLKPGSDTVITD
ncbi:hypothetical protein CGCA056_v000213 [Colletotrichum aenigma]|uniref:uncharacterized protein n=1 Tax=Colletotrichum aenigma TaxID=1215731 RepID=UPI001872B817|nr:uncharacterized protein CGCA056_v000213 [Colletotrichum aenigma]KAF5528225.1 hypothetical protein CGCA056_v000213 [Colletotrichum aenigma]